MAMIVLKARRYSVRGQIVIRCRVHLDDSKTVPGPPVAPDPRYVFEWERVVPASWLSRPVAERNAFLADLKTQLTAEATARLAEVAEDDAGGAVIASLEGTTL